MIKSELRATVSSGFIRPPTSTGIWPKLLKSKSSFAVFGGNQLAAMQAAATPKMIHGRKRFMRLPSAVVGKTLRDEIQIALADRQRQSHTPHTAQRSSGYAPLAKSLPNRLSEIRPDKMFRRDSAADDSCKSRRRGSPNARDRSK